jgi:hypothetical protein
MESLGLAIFEDGKGVDERLDNSDSERHESGGQRDRSEVADRKFPDNIIDRLVAHSLVAHTPIVSPDQPLSANDPDGPA